MVRRTTIEIDERLLARAKKALGAQTTRATVEEALRRAAEAAEGAQHELAAGQAGYLRRMRARVDLNVLRSREMWP